MARIAGVDIPKNKRGVIALTYIFGIGDKVAKDILKQAKVDPSIRTKNLTPDELKNIQVRWDAMTKFLDERGIGAVDVLYDEKLKVECMKVMQEAGNREALK